MSLVFHPRNPYLPTTHANVRHFRAQRDGETVAWWFGGGFDLTPFYPFDEDVLHWHRTARELCEPFGGHARYDAHKRWCDEYFFLKHRNETRGVGGLFFDDLHERLRTRLRLPARGRRRLPRCLPADRRAPQATRPTANASASSSCTGADATSSSTWSSTAARCSACSRGGRTESILMSLPPLVRWEYGYTPEAGSAEARLADYLRPRDWLPELAMLPGAHSEPSLRLRRSQDRRSAASVACRLRR